MTGWDEQWRAQADAWIGERLDALGLRLVGAVEQPHVRPWSTVLRLLTDDGTLWFKANAPGCAHEAAILRTLAVHRVPHVLRPLALDTARGWLLLPDGGPTLRTLHEQARGIDDWAAALASYAELQRAAAPHVAELLAVGVPDLRPDRMPALLGDLLLSPEVLADLAEPQQDQLRALVPAYAGWCAELASAQVPVTVQHDDLHDGNVLRGPHGWTVFDWSDACVAHPFGTLLVTLRSAAAAFSLAPGDPELVRLRDGYLEPWTDIHDRATLVHLAVLAVQVGKVGRALSWQRALAHLPRQERGDYATAVGGWLEELLEPDVA